jgi:GAF domain-containing protein
MHSPDCQTSPHRYEEEVRSKKRNMALLQVVKVVATPGTNVDTVIRSVMNITQTTLNCHKVSLFQVDPINQELVCKVSEDAKGFRIGIKQGIVGHVASSGEHLNIADVYHDPRFNQDMDRRTNYRTRTMLCVPVRARGGHIVAVIQAINKICHACGSMDCSRHGVEFESEDVALIDAFAVEISAALQRQQLEMAFSKVMDDANVHKGVKGYINQFQSPAEREADDPEGSDQDDVPESPSARIVQHRRASTTGGGGGPGVAVAAGTSSDLTRRASIVVNHKVKNTLQMHASLSNSDPSTPLPTGDAMALEEESWAVLTPSLGFGELEFQSFDFDYFERCTPDALPSLIVIMFQDFNLFQHFHISVQKFHNFVDTVIKNYHVNPYHNFLHAFSVTHVAYLMMKTPKVREALTPADVLSVLIASLCHDLQHPGTNNLYHINTISEFAVRYNDVAVLESHHASMCFTLLQESDCNILSGLNKGQFREVRSSIISAILHTDMSRHNDLVKTLKTQVASRDLSRVFVVDAKDDRLLLRDLLVHSGDLANPILPFHMYSRWADLIFEELHAQSQLERSQGLPSALRIEKKDEATIAELQVCALFIVYSFYVGSLPTFSLPLSLHLLPRPGKFHQLRGRSPVDRNGGSHTSATARGRSHGGK